MSIDDNPFDKIVPPADLLYVGWTEPGERFNVSIDVAHSGTTRPIFSTHRTAAGQYQWM